MNENRDLTKSPLGIQLVVLIVLLSGTTVLQSAPQTVPPVQAKTGPVDQPSEEMPVSIRRHSKAFQEAWRQIQAAIRQNERLKKPRPEPYLDRAELLATAQDHQSAMKDCLTAVHLVRSSSNNLVEQARYLGLLEHALQRIVESPEPLYIADADQQFSRGRSLFFRGLNKTALARFDGAVMLSPKEPLFLYFRGLTLKRLGRDAEATSDIRRAVSLDVQQLFGDSQNISRYRLRTHRAKTFERIQGPLRFWMESHFDGVLVPSSPDLEPTLPAK